MAAVTAVLLLFLSFTSLEALYAGAVYGTTEGKVHELSYARCLEFLLHA